MNLKTKAISHIATNIIESSSLESTGNKLNHHDSTDIRFNILLLAAGKGQRFHQSCKPINHPENIKQLAKINGTSMVNHTINRLRSLMIDPDHRSNIYVALGANQEKVHAVLPDDITPLFTESYSLGMGHTIAESVMRITNQSAHILITLADQVLISSQHYQDLINKSMSEPNKIVATLCKGKIMAPAIFPHKYHAELTKLQGDKGAGSLLKSKTEQSVITIACSEAAFDIDTLADLKQINRLIKSTIAC